MVFWLHEFILASVATFLEFVVFPEVSTLGAMMTPMEIAALSAWIAYVVSAMCTVSFFFRYRQSVAPLLQRNGRVFRDVAPFVMCALPTLGACIRALISTTQTRRILSRIAFLGMETTMATFIMVYLDVVNNIVTKSNHLEAKSRDPGSSLDELVTMKWEIRDKIWESNRLFSMPMGGYSIISSLTLLYYSAKVAGSDGDAAVRFQNAGNGFAYLLMYLLLANRSSLIEQSDLETHDNILKRLYREEVSRYARNDFLEVFSFREEWDVLRVGCFVHNIKNFWRFLSHIITIVAVTLQFDYKLVRNLGNLGENVVF